MSRYHAAQSVGILAIWLLAWAFGFWLLGRAPFLPQLAWADDIKKIEVKVDAVGAENKRIGMQLSRIELLTVKTNISEQVKNACLAQRAGSQVDLDAANGQLAELTDEYYTLTGRPYAMPSCQTVLVGTH